MMTTQGGNGTQPPPLPAPLTQVVIQAVVQVVTEDLKDQLKELSSSFLTGGSCDPGEGTSTQAHKLL